MSNSTLRQPRRKVSRAEFDAIVYKIVDDAEPLALHETIYKIQKADLIKDREDLDAFAECAFNIILETGKNAEHTGPSSRYARLGEVLAEINCLLRLELPQFCSCGKNLHKGGRCCLTEKEKPVTYTRIFLDCVQRRFESLMKQFAKAEKAGTVTNELVSKLAACVTFIARLYVRKLVAARVVAQVVAETIGVSERQPHPGCIRCVTEMMLLIGHFMEDSKPGEALMSQFITRLNSLGALRTAGTNLPIYDQEIHEILSDLQHARSANWPVLPGFRVFLQYMPVDWLEAGRDWQELRRRNALPPNEMLLDCPTGNADEGQHVKIVSVLSGRTVAVACSQNLELLTAAKTAATFAELISESTGIYWRRIMLFKPDSTLLEVCY